MPKQIVYDEYPVITKMARDAVNSPFLIEYSLKDLTELIGCSRSTAWRIIQGLLNDKKVEVKEVSSKPIPRKMYSINPSHETWESLVEYFRSGKLF